MTSNFSSYKQNTPDCLKGAQLPKMKKKNKTKKKTKKKNIFLHVPAIEFIG